MVYCTRGWYITYEGSLDKTATPHRRVYGTSFTLDLSHEKNPALNKNENALENSTTEGGCEKIWPNYEPRVFLCCKGHVHCKILSSSAFPQLLWEWVSVSQWR